MLIKKELKIMVKNGESTLDQELVFFQNDRNIDVYFEIVNFKFDFLSATQNETNAVENIGASYSSIKILKPNGEKVLTEKADLVNSKVLFTIREDFMDSIDEVGEYKLQIQLYDRENGKVTIPSINFRVLLPIFEEDIDLVNGQIDMTDIGRSKITADESSIILYELNARKSGLEDWNTGDLISANRMNLIHSNINDLWEKVDNINADTIGYEGDNCNTVGEALNILLYKNPIVNSFTSSISTSVPLGRTIDTVTFYWVYNKSIKTQTFNGISLESSVRTYTYTDRFSSNKTFTIIGNDGTNNCSKSITFSFMNYVFWGTSSNDNYNESFIKGLSNNTLSNSRNRTIAVNALDNQYIYYAYPSRLGVCTFTVGGFEGGFNRVGAIQVSNSYGYIESYYLYKSDNKSLGNTTITIS